MPNEIIRRQNIQTVLQHAMNLFTAHGIENTSLEMIARKSHLTLRSIHNYFPTKAALIAKVLQAGYAAEYEEMRLFFASAEYRNKTGAEQILSIVATTLHKAVEHSSIVFCTAQMQHVVSRSTLNEGKNQMNGNWEYVMKQVQDAFGKGIADGSVPLTTEKDVIDAKAIILALQGIQEQVAYALCDETLSAFFTPEVTVQKYIRQMELILSPKKPAAKGERL